MKVITIGRSSDNIIIVKDVKASRHHCQITQNDNGTFYLLDRNSTNGTHVNGRRITGEVVLNQTDVIRIGGTTLPWQSYFSPVAPVAAVGIKTNRMHQKEYMPPEPLPPAPAAAPQSSSSNSRRRNSSFGIAAFILSLLGISPLAILFGIISMSRREKFMGFGVVGFIFGIIGTVVGIIVLIVYSQASSYNPYQYGW